MARKVISLLGTNKYCECRYCIDGKKSNENMFVQESIIELLGDEWDQNDKFIVLLTDEARKMNWYNTEDENRRLVERLADKNLKIKVIEKSIKDGKNIDEIWSIFDTIMYLLEDGDEVIFDITNSFRSIPMIVLPVLNYAKRMKNIKISGIYYGAFDISDYYSKNKREFELIDLKELDEFLNWSNSKDRLTE